MVNEIGNVSTNGKVTIGDTKGASEWPGHIHARVGRAGVPDGQQRACSCPTSQSTYTPGKAVYRNCLVPARTNPTFNSRVMIEGVLYIGYPNKVTFAGGATVPRHHRRREAAPRRAPTTPSSSAAAFNQYGMETLVPVARLPAGPARPAAGRPCSPRGSRCRSAATPGSIGGHDGRRLLRASPATPAATSRAR